VPKLKYFVQCDSVEKKDGKFSAIGIFDTIYSRIFPIQHEKFSLLLGFTDAVPGKYEVEMEIVSPSGQSICKTQGEFQATSTEQVINLIFNYEKFPLPEAGRYGITVYVQGDACGEYCFSATQPSEMQILLTEEEKEKRIGDKTYVQTISIKINCHKCNNEFKLQLNLDKNKLPDAGYLPFPPGDVLSCPCGEKIDLSTARKQFGSMLGMPHEMIERMQKNKKGTNNND